MKKTNLVLGLIILFTLNIISGLIIKIVGITFPAPLLGMLILTLLIQFNIIPLHWVEDSCKLLLESIGMFFVPLLVGIVLYYHLISKNLLSISLNVIISTVIIMCVTGGIVELLIHRRNRAK